MCRCMVEGVVVIKSVSIVTLLWTQHMYDNFVAPVYTTTDWVETQARASGVAKVDLLMFLLDSGMYNTTRYVCAFCM